MPQVLLFGAGSIGAIYVYYLIRAGASVTAVCRSNYQAAKESGFYITSPIFGSVHITPSVVASPAEAAENGPWDFVVVSSKSFPGSKPSTAEILAPAVSKETTIVLIQNGIGIEEEYVKAFPHNPILSCVVYLPTTQVAPGRIEMREKDLLEIGTYPSGAPSEHKDRAAAFKDLVSGGGASAIVYDDIQPRRFSKLLLNASWNPICALTRSGDAEFLRSSPEAEGFVLQVMYEVVAVANASGYSEITREMAEQQFSRARARTKGVQPSMLADALGGRQMEVEAIVGNTMRLGKEKEVQVPTLQSLYVLIKALDASRESMRT